MAVLRALRSRRQLGDFFVRRFAAQTREPHMTYFQPPPPPPKPPRRILRAILFGTTCMGTGVVIGAVLVALAEVADGRLTVHYDDPMERAAELARTARAHWANTVVHLDLQQVVLGLQLQHRSFVAPKAFSHSAIVPAGVIFKAHCMSGVAEYFDNAEDNWTFWSIVDGYGGPQTSALVGSSLPDELLQNLANWGCFDRAYLPNDDHVAHCIQETFSKVDTQLLDVVIEGCQPSLPLNVRVVSGILAASGCCATTAIFDPASCVLRVANAGDSRAVIGRWDYQTTGRYIAVPMSEDHDRFNEDEVAQIRAEHPHEKALEGTNGVLQSMRVTRAFNDARFKLPRELLTTMHETLWGPPPLAEGARSPPYLTATPEVRELVVHTGDKPDFLILASRGFWEKMSSEDAVSCVQHWLDVNEPSSMHSRWSGPSGLKRDIDPEDALQEALSRSPPPPSVDAGDGAHYDAQEQTLKWRVGPEYFVTVQHEPCAMHLIRNALGGNRTDLFVANMSTYMMGAKGVERDIAVQVVFFQPDSRHYLEELRKEERFQKLERK